MGRIIIHIGAPRTGTTVLQKSLFPLAHKNIIYSKRAYASSGRITNQEKSTTSHDQQKYDELIKSAINNINDVPPSTFATQLLIEPCTLASYTVSDQNKIGILNTIHKAIEILRNLSNKENKPILISSERLCDTTASLFCHSSHKWADQFMPWQTLCEVIKVGSESIPEISVSLRSPIPYLRSKYLRTFIQRRKMKDERDLSPSEYIQKQAILESNHPGTSALTPAMHSEFIKQLQQHAFVKAFGFQELLASDDVFSLIGLQGEDRYAFCNFPRENKLPFTKEQEKKIEIEITQALKQYSFYGRIMKTQMHE